MELLHKVRARVFTLCFDVRVTYHYRRGKHNIFRKTVPMLGPATDTLQQPHTSVFRLYCR